MTANVLGARAGAIQRLNLCALFVPGVLATCGWWCLRDDPRLAWLDPRRASPHFWIIAAAGMLATVAGVGDWRYHSSGARHVGARERALELGALTGGALLFALMACASLADEPGPWLVPVVATALAVVVAICNDELTYHRRCTREETAYHRALTLGMGVAWVAWVHGAFVARLADA